MALHQRPGVTDAGRPTRARRPWSRYSSPTFYLFIAPWLLIGFLGLTVIPMIYALGLSFTNYDGLSPRWRWVGIANYRELLADPDTLYGLTRTLLLTAITVPLSIAGGLGLALLLNRRMRGIGIFRTIFYVPSIVPIVAVTLIFKLIFDRDTGLANAALQRIGGPTITWLVDPTAFNILVLLILWGLGGSMIVFLAALQNIPTELREAAAIDGADAWQFFRRITLPLLTPVVFFQVIIGVIFSLQRQIEPLLLAVGTSFGGADGAVANVPRGNYLYMVNVYAQFFLNQRFGYGAALLWVLFAVILAITLVIFRTSALWVYYEVEQGGTGSMPSPAAGRRTPRPRLSSVAIVASMVVLACIFLVPFVWMIVTALKTSADLGAFPIHLLPLHPEWNNFRRALTLIDYGKYARNSLFLAILTMVLSTGTSALVGFGFARLRGRGKGPVFLVMLATTMLPPILTVIPTYTLFARLHLIYTYWPWVFWGLGANPVLAFLFRQFFAGIPRELEDAAIMDACGFGRIFWQIFLPLSKPVLATSAVLSFQWTWDDWFRPVLFLSVDNTTLAVAMSNGYADPANPVAILTNVLSAGTILYILPVVALFFVAQRYFVQGIVTTGLKG